MLQISNLSAGYKNREGYVEKIKDINIRIGEGEIVGIIGESGSGKTTLARALAGELFRSYGDIYYDGESIFSKKNYFEFKKRRVYVRQESLNILRPKYSVEFQFKKLFKGGKYDSEKLRRIFAYLDLDMDIIKELPEKLSDGTKHRVVLAMACLVEPEILILDEPTTGLDFESSLGLLKLLKEMKEHTSTLFLSNDVIPVFQICDRIYVMDNGMIVEDGVWDEILEKPHHPHTYDLVNYIPEFNNRNKKFVRTYNEVSGGCPSSKTCLHMREVCKNEIDYSMDGDHSYRCIRYPGWLND